jgi:hypothetical protein
LDGCDVEQVRAPKKFVAKTNPRGTRVPRGFPLRYAL